MKKSTFIRPQKLKGFRDYNPSQMLRKRQITDTVWEKGLLAGFQPIDTPVLEYQETLLGTGGEDTDKEVYRFSDHGDRQVALRFDLTIPFARFVAENLNEIGLPFKKIQIGNSWRGEKPQKGRYREFTQADLDIVGADSIAADVEVISTMAAALNSIVPSNFEMRLGNRIILSALIHTSFPNLAQGADNKALIALDKLEKIGRNKVIALLKQIEGADEDAANKLLDVITAKTESGDTDTAAVGDFLGQEANTQKELQRYKLTKDALDTVTADLDKLSLKLDLSIARGLGYYTGIVYETFITDLPNFGSVASGGRYNGLISRFSSQSVPGVGGSIGVDRLLAAIEETNTTSVSTKKRCGIFVAIAGDEFVEDGFRLLTALRKQGIKCDISMRTNKLANQFKFADRNSFAQVVVIGEDEAANNVFTLKVLETGEEKKRLSLPELITTIM